MNLQEAYYELRFVDAFRSAKGGAFQTFFEKLMGLAYKSDFMACRPWGNQGDRKNDGFLKSERRLFQVYAPTEMDAARTIAKINEDFDGAIVHWGMYFDKWVFAHNAVDGLPPHVQAALLKFENAHTGVTVEPWGLEEFKVVFRRVTSDDRQSWFGFSPTDETKAHLGFKDLQIVLESIATRQSPAIQPIKDVPMGKIEANSLSESVAILLKAGMTKAPLVESFFLETGMMSHWGSELLSHSRRNIGFLVSHLCRMMCLWNCRNGQVVADTILLRTRLRF